jgi:predicted PurR-regulated permease PerM
MAVRDHPARLGDTYAPLGTMRLIEQSIVLLLVVTVIVGMLTVLWPFTTAILFGSTLAIAVWPLRQAMVSRGFGRDWRRRCCSCFHWSSSD